MSIWATCRNRKNPEKIWWMLGTYRLYNCSKSERRTLAVDEILVVPQNRTPYFSPVRVRIKQTNVNKMFGKVGIGLTTSRPTK